MILGAVLAGGQSSRFGSDKALALLGGETLLARAVAALAQWCDKVVVIGRTEAPVPCLADRPAPGMGPLGGIAAALHHARTNGFDAVLTCAVDSQDLPPDLPARLTPAPAYLAAQPVIGLWQASASAAIDAILVAPGKHSVRAFAEAVGARAVELAAPLANINTPQDLKEVELRHGL